MRYVTHRLLLDAAASRRILSLVRGDCDCQIASWET
jgi:hypothetical protein